MPSWRNKVNDLAAVVALAHEVQVRSEVRVFQLREKSPLVPNRAGFRHPAHVRTRGLSRLASALFPVPGVGSCWILGTSGGLLRDLTESPDSPAASTP
jgi:hypothetical protein